MVTTVISWPVSTLDQVPGGITTAGLTVDDQWRIQLLARNTFSHVGMDT